LFLDGLESRIVLSTFDVATEAQLRSAITSADANTSSANTINVTASITLTDTTAGQLVIDNGTTTAKSWLRDRGDQRRFHLLARKR
jgi:hypothetical protein